MDLPRPHKVVVFSSSIKDIQLDWAAVRHLSLDVPGSNHSPIDTLSLLSKGKQLRVVDLYIEDPVLQGPLTGTILAQNSIRNLRLFNKGAEILLHTLMPYLEALSLWGAYLGSTDILLSFLQRSACPLKTLDLRLALHPPEQEFINIFRCTPKLQHLSFCIINADDIELAEKHIARFLEHLAMVAPRDSESSVILPLLRKFVYVGPMVYAAPSLFLDAIEARDNISLTLEGSQVTQPVEELIIHRYAEDGKFKPLAPTESDLERILRLNAAGKNVSILDYVSHCEAADTNFSAYYYGD